MTRRSIGNCSSCCGGTTCGNCTLPNSWYFTLVMHNNSSTIRRGYACGNNPASISYCANLEGTYILNTTQANYDKTLRYSLKFTSDGLNWEVPLTTYTTTTVRGRLYESDAFSLCDGVSYTRPMYVCNEQSPGNIDTIECADQYRFIFFVPSYAYFITTNRINGRQTTKYWAPSLYPDSNNCFGLFAIMKMPQVDTQAIYFYDFGIGINEVICRNTLDVATGLDIALINFGSAICDAPPPYGGVALSNDMWIYPYCSVAQSVQAIGGPFSTDPSALFSSHAHIMSDNSCKFYLPWDVCNTTNGNDAHPGVDYRYITLSRGR